MPWNWLRKRLSYLFFDENRCWDEVTRKEAFAERGNFKHFEQVFRRAQTPQASRDDPSPGPYIESEQLQRQTRILENSYCM